MIDWIVQKIGFFKYRRDVPEEVVPKRLNQIRKQIWRLCPIVIFNIDDRSVPLDLHLSAAKNIQFLAIDVDLDQVTCVKLQRINGHELRFPSFADVRKLAPVSPVNR